MADESILPVPRVDGPEMEKDVTVGSFELSRKTIEKSSLPGAEVWQSATEGVAPAVFKLPKTVSTVLPPLSV